MTPESLANVASALRWWGRQRRSGGPITVPGVPDGTLLALRPGEWGVRPGVVEVGRYIDIRTVRIYRACSAPGVIVVGHHVECIWPSIEPHPPCLEVFVTSAGLAAAAARVVVVPAPEVSR